MCLAQEKTNEKMIENYEERDKGRIWKMFIFLIINNK